MLRNIFVWVFFDVDYPVKADSWLDVELLRASNLSLRRKLRGFTDSYLFVFCGNTSHKQASDIVDKYQFAESHVTTIAGPEADECDLDQFDYGEKIDCLVERWLNDRHPGALTNLNSASKAGLEVWWSGVDAVDSEFDFTDDFATTLPSNHKDKANTWLEILGQDFPLTEDSLQEEQEFLVAAASLCKWLYGFEEVTDNGYDDFDSASVIAALPFEDFYLGYLLGQYQPDSAFYEVMEKSDSESIHDLKAFALQQILENEGLSIRNTLLEFFDGGTGLFWTLYTAIWQSFSKSSETNCCSRLGDFSWSESHELIDAWEYVTGGV